jgi:hypothetical protein
MAAPYAIAVPKNKIIKIIVLRNKNNSAPRLSLFYISVASPIKPVF